MSDVETKIQEIERLYIVGRKEVHMEWLISELRKAQERERVLKDSLLEAAEVLAGGTGRGGVFWRENGSDRINEALAAVDNPSQGDHLRKKGQPNKSHP